ncbi:MAG: YfbM family protein [Armatimonadetes bacterium]|nr:YfbM family protein [Armatimonadota bacterium]
MSGILYAITEEQMQHLLDAGDDEDAVQSVLYEDIEEPWDRDHLCDMDKAWDGIHRCLADGTLSWLGGFYPLSFCILGGNPLCTDPGEPVSLKTPEQVRDIATAVAGITRERMRQLYLPLRHTDYPREWYGEDDFDYIWDHFEYVKAFYQMAAAEGRAVVFAAGD